MRVSLKTTDSGEGDGDGEDEKTPGELGCIDFVAGGWKLQLPVESDTKPGSVLEKSPQELADGYTSEFFFAATDENGQTPWCSTARYRDSKPETPLMPVPRCGKCWTLRTKR